MDQNRDAEAADPVVKSEPELSWREKQTCEIKRMELLDEEMRAEDLQRFPREATTTESRRAEKQPAAPRPPRRFKLADIRKMTHDEYVALHPNEREVIYLLFQMISEIHEALAASEKRLAALEAEMAKVSEKGIDYRGTFKDGADYVKGDILTHSGGMWISTRTTDQAPPGNGWVLAVKSH